MSDGVGPAARRRSVLSGGFIALALLGEWLGHAGSWWLSGGVGPGRALSGPMHTYLGPVGVVLAVVAVTMSGLVWAGLARLSRGTRSLHRALSQAWRSDPAVHHQARALARPSAHARRAGPLRIWTALASVQLVLYLVQENLELRLLGLPGGGLHVLSVHLGLPVIVHGAVAFGATVIAVLIVDWWDERVARASGIARLFVRLVAPRPAAMSWPGDRTPPAAPCARFGLSFAARPPPGWMVV